MIKIVLIFLRAIENIAMHKANTTTTTITGTKLTTNKLRTHYLDEVLRNYF
jgi:hypothetical protein